MFLCSKQPWFFGQKKLWTTYLFNLTIAFYIQLAFKKCISYEWCNSSPKKPLPLDCVLRAQNDLNAEFPDWVFCMYASEGMFAKCLFGFTHWIHVIIGIMIIAKAPSSCQRKTTSWKYKKNLEFILRILW